jgi:hypothetical protein
MGRCARLIPAIVFTALLAACGENAFDGSPVFTDVPRMSGGDGGYAVGTNRDGGSDDDDQDGSVTSTGSDDGEEGSGTEGERGGDGGYAVGTNRGDGDGDTAGGN